MFGSVVFGLTILAFYPFVRPNIIPCYVVISAIDDTRVGTKAKNDYLIYPRTIPLPRYLPKRGVRRVYSSKMGVRSPK